MFHRHTKAGTICRPVSGGMIPAVLLFHYFFLGIVRFVRQWPIRGQVRRIDKITPFKSGTKLSALCVYFIYIADLIGLEFQPCGQECFNVKSVLIIRVGSVLEIGVLGNVVLVRKKRTHTAQLENTLAAIHNSKLILAHQLFATMSSDEFKDASLFHKKGRKCRTGFFHPHVILPPPPKVAQGVVTMQVPALWC